MRKDESMAVISDDNVLSQTSSSATCISQPIANKGKKCMHVVS